jgi:hypothetical protein
MKRRGWWLALAALAACSAEAATRNTPEVQADVDEWRKHPLVTQTFREPPKPWKVTKNHGGRVTFATPCKLDMRNDVDGDTLVVTYHCADAGKGFVVQIVPADYLAKPDVAAEHALAAAYRGWRRALNERHEKSNYDTTWGGSLRINYSGIPGRQITMSAGNRESRARLLIGPRVMVVLQLAGDAGTLSGDADLFFNSLKFQ